MERSTHITSEAENEQTTWTIRLSDGRTVCTHGNGSNCTRIIEAPPSLEAHVYGMPPEKVFRYTPDVLPAVIESEEFKERRLGFCKFLIGSECGRLFDQYFQQAIQEPTAYSVAGRKEKDFPMLWQNRRMRIKFSTKCSWWVEGKVVKFKNVCISPYSPSTKWFIEILLTENFEAQLGSVVEIHGLKSAKQYNGAYGLLTKKKTPHGRCVVIIRSGKLLEIKPENFSSVTRIEREVGRMNVSGGGVLVGLPRDLADRISFEWTDTETPRWETKTYSFEEEEYRLTLESDPSEVKSKRERLLQDFAERTPSLNGPPDCNQDGSPIDTPKRKAFQKYMRDEFSPKFFNLAKTDLQGFEELLMTEPILKWINPDLVKGMCEDISTNLVASKVIYAVHKQRYQCGDVDELACWVHQTFGFAGTELNPEVFGQVGYNFQQSDLASQIGKVYEDMHEFSRSIPWFKASVDHARKIPFEDIFATRINNLAEAYCRLGLLGMSFQVFHPATRGERLLHPTVHAETVRLLKELKNWMGTSGYFLSESGEMRIYPDGEAWNTASLKPLTQVPLHFGVADSEKCWDPIPVELMRELTLRKLPSSLSNFNDKDVKDLFITIYNGDFQVQWLARNADEFFALESKLPRELLVSDNKVLAVQAYRPNFAESTVTLFFFFYSSENLLLFFAGESDETFTSMLTEDQSTALSRRVLHWLIRSQGAKIDNFIPVEHLAQWIMQYYLEAENWKDLIDASVIRTDFIHRSGKILPTLNSLNGVGEAMEAAKKFQSASHVYAGSATFAIAEADYKWAATFFANAGLASKRCDHFQTAEKYYVSCLYYRTMTHGKDLIINEQGFEIEIANLLNNYDTWISKKNDGEAVARQNDGADRSIEEVVYIVLCCLLHQSGFQRFQHHQADLGQRMYASALNDRCTSRQECKNLLKGAFSSSPEVSVFHSRILACKRSWLRCATIVPPQIQNDADRARAAKHLARAALSSNDVHYMQCGTCRNSACKKRLPLEELKMCVCRKASYCSKDCQRAHWHIHKQTCTAKKGHGKIGTR